MSKKAQTVAKTRRAKSTEVSAGEFTLSIEPFGLDERELDALSQSVLENPGAS